MIKHLNYSSFVFISVCNYKTCAHINNFINTTKYCLCILLLLHIFIQKHIRQLACTRTVIHTKSIHDCTTLNSFNAQLISWIMFLLYSVSWILSLLLLLLCYIVVINIWRVWWCISSAEINCGWTDLANSHVKQYHFYIYIYIKLYLYLLYFNCFFLH